jgi:hypothetical protein
VLLASRVFDPDALRRRGDLLHLCGALPAGRRLVLEATHGIDQPAVRDQLTRAITVALRSDPSLSLIVLSLSPTNRVTAGLDFAGQLAEQVHHMPAWVGLDDIAAALSGAAAVVATTRTGEHLAATLGTPVASIETIGADGNDVAQDLATLLSRGKPVDITAAVTTLDGALAELAERLPRSARPTGNDLIPDPTVSALAILQQRLVDERTALQAELSRLTAEIEHLRASPEHRIARPIREGYQRWQRRRT